MANYLTTDTDLEAVADAIRNKGGTSTDLEFPQGFVDAIDAIETGGGRELPEGFFELQHVVFPTYDPVSGRSLAASEGAYLRTSYVPVQYDECAILFSAYKWGSPVFSAGDGNYQFIALPYNYNESAPTAEAIYVRYFASGLSSKLLPSSGDIQLYSGHVVSCDGNGNFWLDGDASSMVTSPYDGAVGAVNSELYIGKRANKEVFFRGEIGKVLITNHGLEKLSLVPAMRESDSAVGFYDLVSKTFLTSSGSINFLPGPIVVSGAEALNIILGGDGK